MHQRYKSSANCKKVGCWISLNQDKIATSDFSWRKCLSDVRKYKGKKLNVFGFSLRHYCLSGGWCLMHGYWLTKQSGHFEGRRHHMKFFAQFAIWHNFYGCFSCRKKQKAEFWVILDCVCPLGNSRKLLIHRVAYQCLLHQFIICTNPRSNPLNFCGKNNWELRELKISVFLSRTFCFLLHSHENHSKFIG